ncbi:MAG: hypothetical protein IKL84_05125, partial [Clostridia bacterium]|nr:hypothetical protein [Clostridia bacterium]
MAHRAVAFHFDRLDAYPVGLDAVAVRALQLLAEIVAAAEARRHARNAAGRLHMHVVREFEAVIVDGALRQGRAHQLAARRG